MENKKNKVKEPTQCHLWQKQDLSSSDLDPKTFEVIKVFLDDDRLKRKLLKCKDCSQLYFYEFYEEIDYIGGNDPQYRTFVPVESKEQAEEISNKSLWEIHTYFPRLLCDFPKDADRPISPKWVK